MLVVDHGCVVEDLAVESSLVRLGGVHVEGDYELGEAAVRVARVQRVVGRLGQFGSPPPPCPQLAVAVPSMRARTRRHAR